MKTLLKAVILIALYTVSQVFGLGIIGGWLVGLVAVIWWLVEVVMKRKPAGLTFLAYIAGGVCLVASLFSGFCLITGNIPMSVMAGLVALGSWKLDKFLSKRRRF